MDDLPGPSNLRPLPAKRSKRRANGQYETRGDQQPAFMRDEVRGRILAYIQAGTSWAVAARAVGITKQTFYEWAKRAREGDEPYVSFIAEVEEYEAICEAQLVATIAIAARRDPNVAFKLLRTRFPERWNENRVEVTQDVVELDEPHDTLEHLSEVAAAMEEAGFTPSVRTETA